MSDKGFSDCSDEILLSLRQNLINGLDEVAKTIDNGTFKKPGTKGAAPPSQSGQITLALLVGIQEELDRRGFPLTYENVRSILDP